MSDLEIIEPKDTNFIIDKGTTKDLIYKLKNTTGNVMRDIDLSVESMRINNLKTKTWKKTTTQYCEVISIPNTILANTTKQFIVRVTIPDNYNETVFDPVLKMDKEIAFSINILVKSKKYVEAM